MKNIKNKIIVLLIVSSLIMGTLPVSAKIQQDDTASSIFEDNGLNIPNNVEYVPNEIIVLFEPGVSKDKIARINSNHGSSVKYTSPYAGFKILHIPKTKTVPQMVEIYSKNPNVKYAVPNSIAQAFMTPNDPYYSLQWHFNANNGINLSSAWDISNGTGVIVAVLDTGVARNAPDLADTHFTEGWNFIYDNNDPNDIEGHGTHVIGTIAQSTNNNIGVAGVAFNSTIMPVKVLGPSGGTAQQLADGIYFATNNGAKIISMSLGFPPGYNPGPVIEDAINYAYNHEVTSVCAAGNDGGLTISYPAAFDKCIAVGATRYDETKAYYSNYGPGLSIVAPGGDITVDQNGDGYGDGVLQNTFNPRTGRFNYYFYQGTSMATPHVSGVAALLISAGVATTPDEVLEAIQSTAKDLGTPGWDNYYGYGKVDAYAALQWIPDDTSVNNSPVATEDDYSVEEDTVLNVEEPSGLLSNDLDDENDPLISVLASGVSNGSLTLNSNGSFTYEPNDDFTGYDSFTYKANDSFSDSNIVTVNITVNPVNDIPVAYDQLVTTQQETAVDIVLTGDDVDGDALDYIIITQPANGILSSDLPLITYSPNSGYIGDDSFTFKVNDSKEDSNPATVSISVTEAKPTMHMHIASIDVSFTKTKLAGKNIFGYATAEVTIENESNIPVPGAIVSGYWNGATSYSNSSETNTTGTVSLDSAIVKVLSGDEFAFTVTDVYLTGWIYDASVDDYGSITVP